MSSYFFLKQLLIYVNAIRFKEIDLKANACSADLTTSDTGNSQTIIPVASSGLLIKNAKQCLG